VLSKTKYTKMWGGFSAWHTTVGDYYKGKPEADASRAVDVLDTTSTPGEVINEIIHPFRRMTSRDRRI
jgi:hypothetical protein